jgi:hypothetical protein
MNRSLVILLLFGIFSCGKNPSLKSDYDTIIDDELKKRLEMLEVVQKDNSKRLLPITGDEIQNDINKLILLTKDVENSGAVIKKVNDYFVGSAKRCNIPYEGFATIINTMSVKTIETTIRTNELNFLDKILYSQSKVGQDSLMGSVY